MTDESVFYNIGKRDAIAEVFALIRDVGVNMALTRFADDLLKMEPDHPHALWYLETCIKSDRIFEKQ